MRGWSSIVAGVLLLALAIWSFSNSGASVASVTFAGAALFLFYRGTQGHGATAAGDVMAPIDFIRDPAGAIVESAIDQVGERMADRKAKELEEQPAFDADAAIARYLANRPEPLPSVADAPASAPSRPQFGRKGL